MKKTVIFLCLLIALAISGCVAEQGCGGGDWGGSSGGHQGHHHY